MSNLQLRGTLLVALSGMLYGILGYFGVKVLDEHLSVETMLFWRFFIAMLCMAIPLVVIKKPTSFNPTSTKNLIKIGLFGAITYSASSGCYFLAAKQIGTGIGMVIFFSYPIFVTLFAWCLTNWRMNMHAFLALVAVIAGLMLLKGHGADALNMTGIGFGVMAALFYAFYIYGSQHTAKTIDSRLLTLLICLGNALIFFLVACMTHTFSWPSTWYVWFNILVLGVVATALPIQLLLDGLKYINPIKASVLSVFEPVVTVLIGLALLHESVSFTQIIGVFIVLAGAILIQFERIQEAD